MHFGSKYVYYYQGGTDEESVSSDSDSADDSGHEQLSADGPGYFGPPVASAGLGKSFKKGISRMFQKKKKKAPLVTGGSDTPPVTGGSDAPAGVVNPEDGSSESVVAEASQSKPAKKMRKKADSNVFTLNVGDNVRPENVTRADKLIDCANCKALLPHFSKFEAAGGASNWKCEFCSHENSIADPSGWKKPTQEVVTYELEPPTAVECQGQQVDEKHIVIFVIDISGSMSATKTCDHTDSSGRRTRSFVSRLDAVKSAAEHEIRKLLEKSPNVRVGLITFGTHVTIYGDGTGTAKVLSEEETELEERLKGAASDFPQLKPIKETFNGLTRVLMDLEIRGMTALGPGLLSGVSLAANMKGSKVIICTDGCANVGFGSLPDDYCTDEEEISSSRAVYRNIGDYAKNSSVTVSVISLEGTDCRLVHLGLVAQITGGVVDIVDPNNMSTQFGNILGSKTLATDVSVTLILHHSLYLREVTPGAQRSTKTEQLGNVTNDTEVVVEFGVKTVSNENEQPMSIEEEDRQASQCDDGEEMEVTEAVKVPSVLPFQVQLIFTAKDGGRYKKVITHQQECTEKRETAESEINMNIVGAATSNTVSNVALAGQYRRAKHAVKARQKMTERYRVIRSDSRDSDVDDFEMDLDSLQNLVKSQTKNVKKKTYTLTCDSGGPAYSLACDSAGPAPAAMHLQAPQMVQSAGMSSTAQYNQPGRSSKITRRSTASAVNSMPDNIANQYYARSKGSYAAKKKSKLPTQ